VNYNARRVNPAKAIYHKFIPETVRNPIGMARRRIADRLTRFLRSEPLPPEELLLNVQMTPFVDEFITIGERSARSIRGALQPSISPTARVLDFGCGCGRTALPLSKATEWAIHGCDVDATAVEWLANELDPGRFRANGPSPPLPFGDASFDAVYAVSVFTHFSGQEQYEWSSELARVLAPRGLAAITTMGAGVIENFPAHVNPANRARLREEGFLFIEDSASFNARAAFHTPGGLARLLAGEFELWQHYERGLDGFQDLTLFVKR
jgi:SAM-dependent methyltransferase